MGEKVTKKIFIAGTKQNDGKTTISLGLIEAFKKRFKKTSFIKPIGQRYLVENGHKIDEDSILIERICGIRCNLKDMSPVAIEKGFTERYIKHSNREKLINQIRRSFERVSKTKELVIIEGTGHAGVGSVFDLSNADVAKLLSAKVILVSAGGLGRPIDEIILNLSLFEKRGVEVIGVIINKVRMEKFKKIDRFIRMGLGRKGIEVFGVIPYVNMLTEPTIRQIIEETGARLICGKSSPDRAVKKILIGAMEPHNAINYIEKGSLLITPGDREDLILTAISIHACSKRDCPIVSGIVLTGGLLPHPKIMAILSDAGIPVLSINKDTYSSASMIHDITIKIRPGDRQKTRVVKGLIERYVDIEKILDFV